MSAPASAPLPDRHPLDRPIWSALAGRQSALALGHALARRIAPDYGPFAAALDDGPAALDALRRLVPTGERVVLLQAGATVLPPGLVLERQAAALQMVLTALKSVGGSAAIEPLGPADAAEMRALADLTEPGPFARRTHELGRFFGIRRGGRLIAMAGERLQPAGFVEVSGVCTHPDHRGRGYAGELMAAVINGILARRETPFLHVYVTNTGAIALYRALGFVPRCEVTVSTLSAPGAGFAGLSP